MKTTALAAAAAFTLLIPSVSLTTAEAKGSSASGGRGGSTTVRGHVRRDGTYVAPHRRTNPDSLKTNNWSSKGNRNPYTGKEGTQDPYRPRAPRN